MIKRSECRCLCHQNNEIIHMVACCEDDDVLRCQVTNNPCGTDTEMEGYPCQCLHCLIHRSKDIPMTPEMHQAQRKSWVIGEMMLEHEDMTREQAEKIYEEVTKF